MNCKMFVVAYDQKCGGCNWSVSRLYAYAKTQEEADKLYESGDAGLCGDCISDFLVETGYEIVATQR